MIRRPGQIGMYADADFCIVGVVDPNKQLPEGPFGDHLGYYSLAHDFPVLQVERVYHRNRFGQESFAEPGTGRPAALVNKRLIVANGSLSPR